MRAYKQRYDKFRAQKTEEFNKMVESKNNEAQVLKEMVKSTNLVVKAKEKDILRLKQRCTYTEGQLLALRNQIPALQSYS